jgi:hypothetical protein
MFRQTADEQRLRREALGPSLSGSSTGIIEHQRNFAVLGKSPATTNRLNEAKGLQPFA